MLPPLFDKISSLLKPRSRAERRGAKRQMPNALTPCQIRPLEGGVEHEAWIHNLSMTGVGLLSTVELKPGTTIQVLIVNTAHTAALTCAVKIVRAIRFVGGNYLLGGEFLNPLQHAEMVPFLV